MYWHLIFIFDVAIIYHSHIAMGLTSNEHFGKQYTNQAEKSFATQGRTPAGFAFNGQTQNSQNSNTATNLYGNSKVSLGNFHSLETI